MKHNLFKRPQRPYKDPHESTFARLRLHFMLWSSGVLSCAFLFIAVAFAVAVPHVLSYSSTSDLSRQAEQLAQQWQASPDAACPRPADHVTYMVACFDSNGNLIKVVSDTSIPEFRQNALAKSALREKSARADTTGLNGSTNQLYSYARVVTKPGRNGILGVIQVGELGSNGRQIIITSLIIISAILFLVCLPLCSLFLAQRAVAPAQLAFKRQQEFIANASHELRTPLALLRADAEVLLRGRERLVEEDVELLEDIVTEAAHMTRLANNMLTLARIDVGQAHLEQEVIDLTGMAMSVAHRARAHAAEADIALHVRDTDKVLVIGDALMLEQVLLALLDNAIKYNRRGGSITVRTYQERGLAYLEVQDSGIGIAAEHLPHLGERFYRVDKARARAVGGNGLGLSIVRGIAVAHGGMLNITSQAGQGTIATLTLPAPPAKR